MKDFHCTECGAEFDTQEAFDEHRNNHLKMSAHEVKDKAEDIIEAGKDKLRDLTS